MTGGSLRRRRGRGLLLYALAYLTFLYLPVLFLPLFSFNDSIFIAFPLKHFTLRWYGEMVGDPALLHALANSLAVGAFSALVSTAIALSAARALTKYRLKGAGAALSFISLPLFIPDIVIGISLLILVNWIAIPLSLVTIGVGHVLICTPFALAVLMSRLSGADPALEEASRDLGRGAMATFLRLTLLLALPGIVASLLLTFIVSFDEFLIAYFLAGTEATLPIFIWGELRFPAKLPIVLALGATILAATGGLVLAAEWLRNLGRGDRAPALGA